MSQWLSCRIFLTVSLTFILSACNATNDLALNPDQEPPEPLAGTQNTPISPWQNSYTDSHGNVWSTILPGQYADCVSETENGQIRKIIDEPNRVACQTSYSDHLERYINDGVNLESQKIYASDAVDACKSIGGVLPDIFDFLFLRNEFHSFPSIAGNYLWTSSSDPNQIDSGTLVYFSPDDSVGFENMTSSAQDASHQNQIRCIKHPGN